MQNSEKFINGLSTKINRNNLKSRSTPRPLSVSGSYCADISHKLRIRNRVEDEIQQYQQLINTDKELILSKSRYSKISFWAQHLKNTVQDNSLIKSDNLGKSGLTLNINNSEIVTPKIGLTTMKNKFAITMDFENKRRFNRDEIRKRLAMEAEEDFVHMFVESNCNRSNKLQLQKINEASDNESHSSDSETCPMLSRVAQRKKSVLSDICSTETELDHPYIGRSLPITKYLTMAHRIQQPQLQPLTDDDKECDFFTKQAKLQIEARMALAQAEDMAHIQMKIRTQKQRTSPITDVIRVSLEKVGIQMSSKKRRVSRQMLTDMNIAQLQVIVNELHTHIEDLNDSLMHYLVERDELHMEQDSMLVDIEDLTRFLAAKEQS